MGELSNGWYPRGLEEMRRKSVSSTITITRSMHDMHQLIISYLGPAGQRIPQRRGRVSGEPSTRKHGE